AGVHPGKTETKYDDGRTREGESHDGDRCLPRHFPVGRDAMQQRRVPVEEHSGNHPTPSRAPCPPARANLDCSGRLSPEEEWREPPPRGIPTPLSRKESGS